MDSENNIISSTNSPTLHQLTKDAMNNEISSTSDREIIANVTVGPPEDAPDVGSDDCSTNSSADSPNASEHLNGTNSQRINQFANEVTKVQNSLRTVDINDAIQIPIVGYEVMEERARFTIFKLKVMDSRTDQSWLVFRRYTDFVRLYSRVKSERPNVNLPLPGKRWFRDNFEPLFLEERVRGLQIFVNSIVRRLPSHPRVREFFCLDDPPQMFSYQPEVQAVYGALEDSISSLKTQLKQKDATILFLQQRVAGLEAAAAGCGHCSARSAT